MAGGTTAVGDAAAAQEVGERRFAAVWIWAAIAWTAFVWVGRIRNALADDELGGSTLAGVLLMCAAFLVLAALVAACALARPGTRARRRLRAVAVVTLGWTTLVWAVRIADIALAGDHEVGFVVVHAALGVVSVVLWSLAAWSAVSVVPPPRGPSDPSATEASSGQIGESSQVFRPMG